MIRPSSAPPPAPGDSVDAVLAEWAEQQVGLDFAPVGVVTRLARVRGHLDAGLLPVFEAHDLSPADFAVVVSLRRAGPPYGLPQSTLMTRLGLTSGTVSVRLTRLVAKGIVTRTPSPDDGRGALVTLTDKGLALFDRVAPEHLHNEDVLLSALTLSERDQLADLLRRLLFGFEHEHAPALLGMVLAPAHLARQMRTAVGLSETPGLLVTDVHTASPAEVAGVRSGDLLVGSNGEELRSYVVLARRTDLAIRAGGNLVLDVVRREKRLQITVQASKA